MKQFSFNISLSVLNHLGRNLYRSFITVLGEAISNSWDADANNVWIYLDKKKNYLVIKDDGNGMDDADFQNKFLKIGYSKRKDGDTKTPKNRPFIGRKGIGKLALLSCANKISIITKTSLCDYVGGTIDNSALDKAITDDLTPDEYLLKTIKDDIFESFKNKHKQGTIIYFEKIKDSIKNTEEYLKYAIALYFRFSLIDNSFKIFFNDEPITVNCLSKLADDTQFLWKINNIDDDPYIDKKILKNLKKSDKIKSDMPIRGFIASVNKPSNLKVLTTKEKVSIDLYVNGRLREKDILRHISSARVVENYLYGQIHFDNLDGDVDRFTSSREGIVSDDPLFDKLKIELKQILTKIIDEWDKWRVENKGDGDPENERYTPRQRKSKELYNEIAKDFVPSENSVGKDRVEEWISKLAEDAEYNFSSYGECFISENLLREYICYKKIKLSEEASKEVAERRKNEKLHKDFANLSINIRRDNNDLLYLSMDHLANLFDKVKIEQKEAGLSRDAKRYKPIRDAMAHTALLTDTAKRDLTATYENIKARIKNLLEQNESQ